MTHPHAARRLLVGALALLTVSLLLLLALRVSTNPVPGELGYDLLEWMRGVTTLVGAGLLVASVTVRQLDRAR